MTNEDMHPAGQEATDAGKLPGTEEASPDNFDPMRESTLKPVPPDQREALEGVQGPGGDSRPDLTRDPGGFDRIDEDPRMTTTREHFPEVRKEDPQFLAEHRVDQEDEIVARPDKTTGEEIAVLRPRISKKGDESEEL